MISNRRYDSASVVIDRAGESDRTDSPEWPSGHAPSPVGLPGIPVMAGRIARAEHFFDRVLFAHRSSLRRANADPRRGRRDRHTHLENRKCRSAPADENPLDRASWRSTRQKSCGYCNASHSDAHPPDEWPRMMRASGSAISLYLRFQRRDQLLHQRIAARAVVVGVGRTACGRCRIRDRDRCETPAAPIHPPAVGSWPADCSRC